MPTADFFTRLGLFADPAFLDAELCRRIQVSAAGGKLGRLAIHAPVQADDLLQDPGDLLRRGRVRDRLGLALSSTASRVELDEPAWLGVRHALHGLCGLGWPAEPQDILRAKGTSHERSSIGKKP